MKRQRTLRDWVRWGASRFTEAGLSFGHGCDNALDESLALVLHAVHLDHDLPEAFLDCRVSRAEAKAIRKLLRRRIRRRQPAAYLIGRAGFAGWSFEVTPDVLVPRSPIAELILRGFSPWLDGRPVRRLLDIGTGSGCIAIACAHVFADAEVDAVDISPQALAVAARNVAAHGLEDRIRLLRSDVFEGLESTRYDLIVSNPPYVDAATMRQLPAEYRNEPAAALAGGDDGLDVVRRILAGASDHLRPGGLLVLEVGAFAASLLAAFPTLPFVWPDLEHGGEGVALLTAEQLTAVPAVAS